MRARSALFTLFGDVVRPAGGDAWLTTLTSCMGALGFSPQATRTALHRMAAEGWVAPTRSGRFSAYRLTELGVERLEEAATRIYRMRAVEWDGRWRLLVLGSATVDSAIIRELQWSGHGRLAPDLWVTPHRQGPGLDRLLDTSGLAASALRFDTTNVDPTADARIVATAWDLRELRNAHATFIRTWRKAAAPADPQEAFAVRIRLVHHWRSFLFLDPGLPTDLLPADWLGDDAVAVFRSLYEAVDEQAWRYYDDLVSNAPPLADAGAAVRTLHSRSASPFVHGIDALQATPARSTA